MKYKLYTALICTVSHISCTEMEDLSDINNSAVNTVSFLCSPMTSGDEETRVSVNVDDGTLYTFTDNDTIGIFPTKGDQVNFSMEGLGGTTHASFDGGGWALKKGITYYAYLPFNRNNYMIDNAKCAIPINYLGQYQLEPNTTSYVDRYIYMATKGTSAVNGSLNFTFLHVGALSRISINIPQNGYYNKVSVCSDKEVFPIKGEINLLEGMTIKNPTFANRIDLNLNNMYFPEAKSTKQYFYLMIPPCDCSDCTLKVVLEATDGTIYECETRNGSGVTKNFVASKYYGFDATFTTPSEPEYVSLSDSNFKSYMVSNFDKNGDNEISLAEAELVEDIDCSRSNQTRAWDGGAITSLSGIEYCTNLKTLICNNNEITNLDLTNNSALTTLFCADNNILNLNVVGCENITKINCSGNKLSSLDVSTNTSLVSLVCGGQTTVAEEELSIVVMVNEEQQEKINTLIDDYSQSSITVELQTGLVSKASGSDFGNGGKF